jgi:4-pyridoxate dehydrogenase
MGPGYDYIVAGAGTAGCVLASRLSEDGAARVLLIEAGGHDRHPLIQVPLGVAYLSKRRLFDWGCNSEPEPHLNGRRIPVRRGKVLGGTSSVNLMLFTRGHPGDYDRWAENGAPGWSYQEVLPWFKRIETFAGGENTWRGGAGPIGVECIRANDPLYDAWIAAGKAAGYAQTNDYNGAQTDGFGCGQYSIRKGRRSSSVTAYLRPAAGRRNLRVATNARAGRILFDGARAVGIEYRQGGQTIRAPAAREIILCAGVFNSPQLLMLSGIGPADHLREQGIRVLADLPVGENLQDHLSAQLMFARPKPGPFRDLMRADRMMRCMLYAYLFGRGPATRVPGGLQAFVKTAPGLRVPDMEFMFRASPLDAHPWFPGIRPPYADGFGIRPTLLHPRSRGRVRLASADPSALPRIFFDLLSDPADLPALRDGVRRARELAFRVELDPFRGQETQPGPNVQSDGELDAWIRSVAVATHHPACTCPIGAVLDPSLRVLGFDNVRVVDASAMPDLVSGHINACILMMAERASALVRGIEAGAAPVMSTSLSGSP